MAMRTNRLAWGLTAILAVVVLGGVGCLSTRCLRRADAEILPIGSWRFGSFPYYGAACGRDGRAGLSILGGYRRYFGFFSVRVK
jgi:hypothetical protein